MASSKSITVTPRYLLPRLTWNGTPRITITAIQGAPISTVRERAEEYRLNSQRYHNVSSAPVRRASFSSLSGASLTVSPSLSSSSHPVNTPIRHNGVYVAVFKPARRAFHSSTIMSRDHHFDTLKFVQRLKNEGFSEEQAVAMMKVLNNVIQESIQNLTRTMVLKEGMRKILFLLYLYHRS